MDTQHTRCNRVNPLLHDGCSRPVQPLETTALQRGTGLLIIPWSLVRIQAGPVFERRPIRSVSEIIATSDQASNCGSDVPRGFPSAEVDCQTLSGNSPGKIRRYLDVYR